MFKISIRIYIIANAVVALILCMFSGIPFTDSMGFLFTDILFSFLFSLPSLIILLVCFWLIRKMKLKPWANWIFLVITTGLIACIPSIFMFSDELYETISIGILSAHGSLLLQSASIQIEFESLNPESENELLFD